MSDLSSCNSAWIMDTFCDDECNFPHFNYDGGDCCLDQIVSHYCTHCFCYEDCSFHEVQYVEDLTLPPPIWTTEVPFWTTTIMTNDVEGNQPFLVDLNVDDNIFQNVMWPIQYLMIYQ